MYRIHAGSPRASPYDAAAPLQAYDLITTIRTPQTAFGGQLPFTWEPLAAPYISAFIAAKPLLSPGNKKRPVYVIVHRSDNFPCEII
jgi:hypothetical protein